MSDNRAAGAMGGDEAFAALVIVVGVLCGAVWSGAELAAVVSGSGFVDVSLGDAFAAGLRLPSNVADPSAAWPPVVAGSLPGPIVYWAATVFAVVVEVSLAVWLWVRVFASRVGTSSRKRLGVKVGARLATRRDLAALVVSGPVPGRFIFGRDGRRLLATESGDESSRGRRSAVAVVGPSQSGKTATVVAGILDWEGPAILSSVKGDLFAETVEQRRRVGRVFVFDPMRTIPVLPDGVTRVGWSPLHAARTVPGAIEVASALLEAAPSEGVTNATYWTSKGQALLWPILFAAAHGDGMTMADVVGWLSSQDGNPVRHPEGHSDGEPSAGLSEETGSEIRSILTELVAGRGRALGLQAAHTRAQFEGFFRLDPRTRSDIYSTAQTLVQAWEDPYISFASAEAAGPVADLRSVLAGNNTLYVCMPLKDASRYSVVFGGLLGSLLRDQAYDIAGRYGRRLPGLLAVIDEAGNTPLRWLPEVASTCSGIGVQLVTVWQSKAQIDATYQSQADAVLTNHATKLFFAGASDQETLRYVTFLGGEEEVASRSANADAHLGGYRRGVGDSTIWRPLLPGEVLRQAEVGHGVLFHHTLPPAHVQGRHVGSDPRLRRLAAGQGPEPTPGEVDARLLEVLRRDVSPPVELLEHLGRSRLPE